MSEIILNQSAHKVSYLDNDKFIKTYDDTYTVSQVLNEALNQARVVEANILTPKVYEVKKYNDKLAIVMEYINGKDLQSLINSKKDIDKYLSIFVETQHKLFMSKVLHLNNSYGRIKNKIFATSLPANIQYGLFYKLREIEFLHDVMHGDYTLSNVILDKNDVPYVIDWSHTAFGDKKLDIAVSYALFELSNNNNLKDIYFDKICDIEKINKEDVLDKMILAYVYIVDRYDEATKKIIYDKIYEIIKNKEA